MEKITDGEFRSMCYNIWIGADDIWEINNYKKFMEKAISYCKEKINVKI